MYRLECKCMLKSGDEFILSSGRAKLLKLISEDGSISKAAKQMDMSYRYAWGVVKEIEDSLDDKVVISERGGSQGGGTKLTDKGKELLETYEELKSSHRGDVYKKPSLTVDGVIEKDKSILLIRRAKEPFKDRYALPGGFVEYGETVEKAVVREVQEETGLKTEINELLGVYSDPERDPRGHTVSTVFSLRTVSGKLKSGSDAKDAKYIDLKELPDLAFDHDEIIKDYISFSSD